ncbi:MAG: hypothetical protein EOO71_19375 [Myxococcaceae bacterium]|nr:MAG: hypothetical protein EOO71_19375 [Myxococcaceae bacterium]
MATMLLHVELGRPESNELAVRDAVKQLPGTAYEHMPLTWIITDTEQTPLEALGLLSLMLIRERDRVVAAWVSPSSSEFSTEKGPWYGPSTAASLALAPQELPTRLFVVGSASSGSGALLPQHEEMLDLLGCLAESRRLGVSWLSADLIVGGPSLHYFCKEFMQEEGDQFVSALKDRHLSSWPPEAAWGVDPRFTDRKG